MLLSLDLRPVVASLVELATAPGCCASPWSLTPSPTAARPWLPGGVGGSWGADSGGCTPRGGPAPASPARTAAWLSPGAWPGGLPCPWNRGTVDTLACRKAARGQAVEPTKSARSGSGCRVGSARVPAWLVGCLRLVVGHASTVRPDPSTLGVVGERGSHHESCLQLVPGSAGQTLDLLQVRRWDALGWALEQRPGGVVGQDDGADIGEALAQVVVLEAFVGGPHVDP
jgi:hypothetical protein